MFNRRQFLGTSAAFAAPFILTGCAAGRARTFAANEKVNIGVVGIGRISTTMDMPLAAKYRDLCRITAVCDLDAKRLAHGVQFVKNIYKEDPGYPVKTYADYHDLLADPSIDAVEICIPDHWPALVACAALAAGKHIWLQKPFAQTITEGRLIANLAKMRNRVVQVGSWQRSVEQFHRVCELVRNGRIGEIKRVEVGIGLDKAGGSSAVEPVPANLNYDMWLGPTDEKAPYNWTRVHQQDLRRIADRPGWIQMAPYGWGMITNWGAHHLDIARWGLGALGAEGVSGTCEWMDLSGGKLWNVHTTYDLHFKFNGGKTDVHVCNKYQNGVKFIGEKGDWLWCTRDAERVTPSDPFPKAKPGELPPIAASRPELMPKMKPMYVRSQQIHVNNWLDAVAANDPTMTVTNAEGGHRSTSLCSLGQMCMELGRGKKDFSLDWDAAKESTGNAEADRLMKPLANGKFDLNVNLAEFGLTFDDVVRT